VIVPAAASQFRFRYVKDCGRAIALLMLAERLNHGTYNVSTGRLVRNSEVVAAINGAVPGANMEGRNPDRPPDNYLDTTRLRADTGFRLEYDVDAPYRTTSTG
jgi:UDP-glucose 4-epimerase